MRQNRVKICGMLHIRITNNITIFLIYWSNIFAYDDGLRICRLCYIEICCNNHCLTDAMYFSILLYMDAPIHWA